LSVASDPWRLDALDGRSPVDRFGRSNEGDPGHRGDLGAGDQVGVGQVEGVPAESSIERRPRSRSFTLTGSKVVLVRNASEVAYGHRLRCARHRPSSRDA
jgi:hypothetical protein